MEMKYHKTKDGKKIKLVDLELSHLENIIKWIERKAKEGITVRMGGGSVQKICGMMKKHIMEKKLKDNLILMVTKLNWNADTALVANVWCYKKVANFTTKVDAEYKCLI